ncbi:BRCA1-A complex subunit RAP80 isoform X2 [Alexandromys fortis]|uniref:BRCA1-A complex subunit RAP80 isoform X2 n=1 Tax=Alexandromys fortis TaxID=100897 RepID=UPI0021525DDA|nr:BRCA1-A complex subunit RAP80 isoform X2 [Microtus fortis]
MPRRKKKIKEASESHNSEKKDRETTSPVSIKKKRRLEDLFIVISDSDGEEAKEENGLQKMKTKQSNRSKCLAKRKITQMSEEEQFALALRMSEQEAREVNSQEEKEEELLRKAIAESLNNECGQEDETSEKNEGISEDMGDEAKEERQESRASVWNSETKDFQKSSTKSLKQELLLEEEPTTSHGQSSQGLFVEETSEEVLKSSEEGNCVPVSQSIAALANKRNLVLMPESSTEEITVCPETQLSSPEPLDLNREDSPGSSEVPIEVRRTVSDKQVGDRENGEKAIPTPAFSSSTRVSCPLCDQDFPPTKIEQHAMYCNGPMEQETVLTRKRREARNKSDSKTSTRTALDINKKEKCYLCKSLVPLGEYECHVEACLQHAKGDRGDGTEVGKRTRVCATVEGKQQQQLRKPKDKDHSEGRLLSLLEQSEHKTIGVEKKNKSSEARTFKIPSSEVEEASCSREMQSSLSQLNLNESPIKSFVPVSEATNCLVDFKDQFTFRSRTKSGRGRRRKS